MDNYKIIVSEAYQKDLKGILRYITHNLDAPCIADELLNDIENTILGLSSMPQRFERVDDPYLKHKDFRKCLVKNYIIFYKVHKENKTIVIHCILHARQKWLDIL